MGLQLSIIFVNWNSKEYLRKCLSTVYAHTRNLSFEVIVVDSGSFDGCGKMLAAEFPQVNFIQSEKNLGFGKANNLGATRATGENLLFLNPDTELLENSLPLLHNHLNTLPQAGGLGCRLLNTDRTLQTSCIQSFPTVVNQVLDSDFLRERFPGSKLWGTAAFLSTNKQPQVVEVVSGACLMVKRDLFQEVGGFTETYFMYGEDLDLCFKLRKAGYLLYYAPETSIVHHGGSSTQQAKSNFSNVMTRESVYRFLRLNRGAASALSFRVATACNSFMRLCLILPLLLGGKRLVRHGFQSVRKWFAILRWSLGCESWTQKQN